MALCNAAKLKIHHCLDYFWTAMPCSFMCLIAIVQDKVTNMLGVTAGVGM